MNRIRARRRLLAALVLVCAAHPAWSQMVASAALAPHGPVKMDREDFLRTHRWDPVSDTWALNPGTALPAGVKPRADVLAARQTYLSTHRWDGASAWRPLVSGTRNLDAVPRDQLRMETQQFMRSYRWDETTEEWVKKQPVGVSGRSHGK